MLQFKNVSFRYDEGKPCVIENLSFLVSRGEFVSILGPSGCGKSTIFRLINGLIAPMEGEIFVEGKNIRDIKNYCGYMPQNDMLFPWRTISKNVRLPLEIRGNMKKEEMDKRVADALFNAGLSSWAKKSPSALSGGMKKRAAFARTLLTGSELLLLDEPFSALDYITRLSMQKWLLDQRVRENKTILFITHDVDEAIFLSDRILFAHRTPITHLTSIKIPIGYPRYYDDLKKHSAVKLKEQLIQMLGG